MENEAMNAVSADDVATATTAADTGDAATANAATVEPEVTEPGAAEPAATEPTETEPAATEPATTEPAAIEPEATEPDYQAINEALRAQMTGMMAQNAALSAGVRPERAAYAVRLADIGGIDPTAADAAEQIGAAMAKVLNDVPELKSAPVGTGSKGDHARTTAQLDAFERGLKG